MDNTTEPAPFPVAVDVLVVGQGPVGATLSALLGRYGVRTLVVDKVTDVMLSPRAIALDNEALRFLQLAGMGEGAFDQVLIPEVKMHCPIVGQFSRANTSGTIDGHPKLVTFYQPDLEYAARAQAATFAEVSVRGGWQLTDLQQQPDHVRAVLENAEGEQHTVSARYLVGADGASSTVRGLIGQGFEGHTYGEDWLIVDTHQREGKAISHVEFLCDHRRPTPHMPAPGGRERWEFMLHRGETREEMEQPERIAALLNPWIKANDLHIERKAVYRFHARSCKHFQVGRVFLVGDAAHITPPFVGQGLVAGLRDVANLAWKLAWVLRGFADPHTLESYDRERRPHAQEMIAVAKRMGQLVMPRNALVGLVVHGLMASLNLLPPLRRRLENLDLKPKNQFKQGLFSRPRRNTGLICGAMLPQCWVRRPDGTICLSDDVLGDNLVMVGFGVDPQPLLNETQRQHWRALGGSYLQLGRFGHKSTGSTLFVEDISDVLLDRVRHACVVVVRPDRFIMHIARTNQAAEAVLVCQRLLRASHV